MSVSFNSNSNSAKAEILNREADPFSCQHCPALRYYRDGVCDRFQKAGRCIRAALVAALNANRVQIVISGDDAKLIEVKR